MEDNHAANGYKDLTIVGVGASAGGLEAIQKLFDHVRTDTAMAFVIIQHLSPDFKSLMPELLAKHTRMQIYTAEDGQLVKPNCIYLNQRGKNLIVKHNRLHLVDKAPKNNLNLPIDLFFHSLGEDRQEKSIGIILSGTGSDGSRGIRTIKENGGTIIAQDPKTAQFDGMPNYTISTNLVDFILHPAGIAEVINKLKVQPELLFDDQEGGASNDSLFQSILEEIHKVTGIDFSHYKKSTIIRRLSKRMSIKNKLRLTDYLDYLKSSSEEVNVLQQDLLIGVTAFFRDREAFDILKTRIIPKICENRSGEKSVRIWVPGCSSGEEVFSIAILFDEYIHKFKPEADFKIFATDVDTRALSKASLGYYHINAGSDIEKGYLDKYFVKTGDKIQIIKRIRERVVFSQHNLLKDPPFIRMDLVSCRNLLIYMESKAKDLIIKNFRFSLVKSGVLFLGGSESLGNEQNNFAVLHAKWNFFENLTETKMITDERDMPLNRFHQPHLPESARIPKHSSARSGDSDEVYHRYLSKKNSPDSLFIDKNFNLLFIKGDAGKRLSHNEGIFDSNLLNILPQNLVTIVRNVIRRLDKEENDIIVKDIAHEVDGQASTFDINFHKVKNGKDLEDVYLLEFSSENRSLTRNEIVLENLNLGDAARETILDLEEEVKYIRTELQNVVEELETSNEELQASNEELMASNEELQSTNEELQSVNEELYTVNSELQEKNRELRSLHNDMTNLLNSSDVGTLFLDSNLRIRKFTKPLERLFTIEETDIGRPISSFTSNFDDEVRNSILQDSQEALDKLKVFEKEVRDLDGNYFLKRITPFVTTEKKIEGVLITFVEINVLKETQIQLQQSYDKLSVLYDNSPDMLVSVAAKDTVIINCNKTLLKVLDCNRGEVIGKSVYDFFHDSSQEELEMLFRKFSKSGTVRNRSMKLKKKGGEILHVSINVRAVRDSQGKILYYLSSWRDVSDLVRKDDEIKSARERVEMAARATGVAFWEYDIKADLTTGTQEWSGLFGSETLRCSRYDWIHNVHPNDISFVVEALNKCIKDKEIMFDVDFRYLHPLKRQLLWIQSTAKVISVDEKGNPLKLSGVSLDITRRKKNEIDLIRRINEQNCLTDLTNIISDENNSIEELLELVINKLLCTWENRENLDISIHFNDIVKTSHNYSLGKWSHKENFIVEGKTAGNITLSYRLDTLEDPFPDSQKLLLRNIAGILSDKITNRIYNERLKESEERYQLATEAGNNGIWDWWTDSDVVFYSQQWKAQLGYSNDELQNSFEVWEELLHPEDKSRMLNSLESFLKKPKPYFIEEFRMRHKDGSYRWIYNRAAAVRDDSGKVIRMFGAHSDITEKRINEQELIQAKKDAEQANAHKNYFLANMSHEIRTPMNGVIGFTALLKKKNLSQEEQKEYLDIIDSNSKQLLSLIDDIIDVAKIEAGELNLIIENCNLSKLFQETQATFNQIKKSKDKDHIRFQYEIPQEYQNLVIKSDFARLKQVLYNLLGNSLKFSENGTISYGFTIGNEKIRFFVKDEGIGIPKNELQQIFERFKQVQYEDKAKYGGTGLGLSICKGIITLLGGTISVDSELGKGTVFSFDIPLEVAEVENIPEHLSSDPQLLKALEGKTILVAEDNKDSRHLFSDIFQGMDLDVLFVKHGEEAVSIYKKTDNIDLVLMDLRMPFMNGYKAAEKILKINPNARIIAQTANAMESEKDKCLKSGFVDFLPKPLERDSVVDMLLRWIN